MKRVAMPYKHAIEWIAYNDDTEFLNSDEVMPSVSISLVADIYQRSIEEAVADLRKAVEKARS